VTGLVRGLATVRRYVGDVMGDNHYQRYVAHHRRHHPGTPLMSEREYWRTRHAEADANPGARCC
jgi:uncharacterized short protein YbdD (DUF466 family)